MLFSLLVFLPSTLLPLVSSQQCSTSEDCLSPDSPHCSKWGWCQWTDEYGSGGPGESGQSDGLPPGSCDSDQDCSPRAPFCSSQGYCTDWQPKHKAVDASHNVNSGRRTKTESGKDRANHRTHQSGSVTLRTHQARSQTNHLDTENDRRRVSNNFKRSFELNGDRNKFDRRDHQARPKSTVPKHAAFEPMKVVPVPGIQARVPEAQKTSSKDTSIERSSDIYDYYDYTYYTEFEVLKKDEEQHHTVPQTTQRSTTQSQFHRPRSPDHGISKDHRKQSQPLQGGVESQGCLTDCVTECVKIQELSAYRDCVEFCGRTCIDKK